MKGHSFGATRLLFNRRVAIPLSCHSSRRSSDGVTLQEITKKIDKSINRDEMRSDDRSFSIFDMRIIAPIALLFLSCRRAREISPVPARACNLRNEPRSQEARNSTAAASAVRRPVRAARLGKSDSALRARKTSERVKGEEATVHLARSLSSGASVSPACFLSQLASHRGAFLDDPFPD